MPPKRTASASSHAASKRPRPNADAEAPFSGEDDEDEDEEDEEDEDEDEDEDEGNGNSNPSRRRCDGGRTCICNKPVEEHPDHPWKITFAAKRKFFNQRSHCSLRDPDCFGMHTYNDHAGFGVLEAIENLILDFEEAKDNVDEKWVICETLGYFIHTDHTATMFGINDGERVRELCLMLVRLFMTTLALLERDNLLGPDSRIKNLGTIMALWMFAKTVFNDQGCVEAHNEEPEESLGPKKDKKKWMNSSFDSLIFVYAKKYNITLSGPRIIDSLIEDCEQDMATEDVDLPLPESNNLPKSDPFNFVSGLKKYKSDCSPRKIGGDKLDITTFKSTERKGAAFDGRDPLGRSEITSLKEGLVLMVG
ncbi:hypothetical protein AOL_s00054g671 [Orbilia oligospora ATCC 24927]|uniref:Uncharacterized protein n=1 Tax=Arthrobotrys oligospora (strain ATCC 24927 / CBS 115.81 / DSM 1491) TaxID=756982 RepID=G1X727_ARTOA|nr:hypothetical protein AOL_s00054g671 [Orbilia oligospora ATCC 24927]EGX50935.1 hypothetical protein AOL_s00054g671 [Orbilia oligospora ATCC 24927]